jgi:hypothetical protein
VEKKSAKRDGLTLSPAFSKVFRVFYYWGERSESNHIMTSIKKISKKDMA